MNSLESYLQGNSLDDFLAHAVLSERQFVAEKQSVLVLENGGRAMLTEQYVRPCEYDYVRTFRRWLCVKREKKELPEMNFKELKVPRRPAWDTTTTKEELNVRERAAFLEWRREIAEYVLLCLQ